MRTTALQCVMSVGCCYSSVVCLLFTEMSVISFPWSLPDELWGVFLLVISPATILNPAGLMINITHFQLSGRKSAEIVFPSLWVFLLLQRWHTMITNEFKVLSTKVDLPGSKKFAIAPMPCILFLLALLEDVLGFVPLSLMRKQWSSKPENIKLYTTVETSSC